MYAFPVAPLLFAPLLDEPLEREGVLIVGVYSERLVERGLRFLTVVLQNVYAAQKHVRRHKLRVPEGRRFERIRSPVEIAAPLVYPAHQQVPLVVLRRGLQKSAERRKGFIIAAREECLARRFQ